MAKEQAGDGSFNQVKVDAQIDQGAPEEMTEINSMNEPHNEEEGSIESTDENSETESTEVNEVSPSEPAALEGEEESGDIVTSDLESEKIAAEEPIADVSAVDLDLLSSNESSDSPATDKSGAIEIEGASLTDGSIRLSINGIEVGPLADIDRTLEKTSQQIDKAKKLIFITAGAGAFVLIFAVLFYVLMSIQLSTKTEELDRMLVALGKRGIQLGDGIEELVRLETDLNEMRGAQSLLINDVALLREASQTQASELRSEMKNISDINMTSQKMVAEIGGISKSANADLANEIKQSQRAIVSEFSKLVNQQRGLANDFSSIKTQQNLLSERVGDLYLIKKAELEGKLNLKTDAMRGE